MKITILFKKGLWWYKDKEGGGTKRGGPCVCVCVCVG